MPPLPIARTNAFESGVTLNCLENLVNHVDPFLSQCQQYSSNPDENAKPDGIIIYFTGNRPSFIPDCVKWKNKEETIMD